MSTERLSRFSLGSELKESQKDQTFKSSLKNSRDNTIKRVVEKTYLDPRNPGSYTGVSAISNLVKEQLPQYTSGDIKGITKNVLSTKPSYYLNVQPKNNFLRSRISSAGVNYMFDTDLMNMYPFGRYNKGFKYVLLVIDIFTRFVMTRALKSKSHVDVVPAMESILKERTCKVMRSDAGGEFTSYAIKQLYRKYKIKHYIAYNDGKASFAERGIKSIKNKLIRYMRANNTYKWQDVLQDITHSYNNTIHSSIGRKPSDVTNENEDKLFHDQYNSISSKDIRNAKRRSDNIRASRNINIGDYVRLSIVKKPFQKEYEPKWTGELFQVYKTTVRDGCIVFYVRDLLGEVIEGSFYVQQLQKALVQETDLYRYEKVVGRRTRNGVKQRLIRWAYYPPKFDEWVSERQFRLLKKVLV